MTVLLAYVPTPQGAAALETAIAEAKLRDESLVVLNGSRGDAYDDPRFAQPGQVTEVEAAPGGSRGAVRLAAGGRRGRRSRRCSTRSTSSSRRCWSSACASAHPPGSCSSAAAPSSSCCTPPARCSPSRPAEQKAPQLGEGSCPLRGQLPSPICVPGVSDVAPAAGTAPATTPPSALRRSPPGDPEIWVFTISPTSSDRCHHNADEQPAGQGRTTQRRGGFGGGIHGCAHPSHPRSLPEDRDSAHPRSSAWTCADCPDFGCGQNPPEVGEHCAR